jgi:hypothetical protein
VAQTSAIDQYQSNELPVFHIPEDSTEQEDTPFLITNYNQDVRTRCRLERDKKALFSASE